MLNANLIGHTVTLTSADTIGQSGGIITALNLTGSSVGGTTLNKANLITNLGTFDNTTSGDFALTDAATLNVTGALDDAVSDTGNVTLKTTGSGHNIALGANVTTTGAQQVTLTSAGTISQSGGIITTGTLTGSSVGNTTLNKANLVTDLGAFTTSGGTFALTNAQPLTVTGTVDTDATPGTTNTATAGDLTLTTTGASDNLVLNADLIGHTVTLTSADTIGQSGGIITALTLTGSSVGGTTLNKANVITNLGTFDNTTSGDFALTDAATLNVTGALDDAVSDTGNVTLKTTGSGHNIALGANVTTTGAQQVTLTSAGTISQSGGIITTGTLTGSSVGNTTLNKANLITDLGAFTTSGGNFALTNAQPLTVTGTVDTDATPGTTNTATAGDLTLTTTGASDNLVLNADLIGHTVTLTSADTIGQSGGIITALTLTGSSVGGTTLNKANKIANLGAFTTSGGNFALTDAQLLTVSGTVDTDSTPGTTNTGSAGDLTLTTTGASNNLVLNANLIAHFVTLNSADTIGQSGGVITANTLTGSSVGSTTLNKANKIANLDAFTTSGGTFALADAQDLIVAGDVDTDATPGTTNTATAGDLMLTTTGVGNGLVLNADMIGHTVTLTSADTIGDNAVVITAASSAGSSVGNTSLNGANQIDNLGAFTTSGGAFALTDAQALTVTGTVDTDATPGTTNTATAGDLTLTTTGASDNLVLNANLIGHTVTLTSADTIGQSGGVHHGLEPDGLIRRRHDAQQGEPDHQPGHVRQHDVGRLCAHRCGHAQCHWRARRCGQRHRQRDAEDDRFGSQHCAWSQRHDHRRAAGDADVGRHHLAVGRHHHHRHADGLVGRQHNAQQGQPDHRSRRLHNERRNLRSHECAAPDGHRHGRYGRNAGDDEHGDCRRSDADHHGRQ